MACGTRAVTLREHAAPCDPSQLVAVDAPSIAASAQTRPARNPAEVRVYTGYQLRGHLRNVPFDNATVCDIALPIDRIHSEFDPSARRLYDSAITRAALTHECGDPPYPIRGVDASRVKGRLRREVPAAVR